MPETFHPRKRPHMTPNEERESFMDIINRRNAKFKHIKLSSDKDPAEHKDWLYEHVEGIPTYHHVVLTPIQIRNLGRIWITSMTTGAPINVLGIYTSLLALQLGEFTMKENKAQYRHYFQTDLGSPTVSQEWLKIQKGEFHFIPPAVESHEKEYHNRTANHRAIDKLSKVEQALLYSYLAYCAMRVPFTNTRSIFSGDKSQAANILKFFMSHYKIKLELTPNDIQFPWTHMEQLQKELPLGSEYLNTIILLSLRQRDLFKKEDPPRALFEFGLLMRANQSGVRAYSMFVKTKLALNVETGTLLSLVERSTTGPAVKYLEEFILTYESETGRETRKWWQWSHCFKREYMANFHSKRNQKMMFFLACLQSYGGSTDGGDPRSIAVAQGLSESTQVDIMAMAKAVIKKLEMLEFAHIDDGIAEELSEIAGSFNRQEFLDELNRSKQEYQNRMIAPVRGPHQGIPHNIIPGAIPSIPSTISTHTGPPIVQISEPSSSHQISTPSTELSPSKHHAIAHQSPFGPQPMEQE